MDCETFRSLYAKYSRRDQPREVWDSDEYEDYVEHSEDCASCGDWWQEQVVKRRGRKVGDYPCVHIAYRVTDKLDSPSDNPFDDPDVVIWKFENSGQYGIPIRDGGSSFIAITHCPWCGKQLN